MHQDSSHVVAFDVRFAYAEMYGEIVKARRNDDVEDVVVLTGTRVNAYDTPANLRPAADFQRGPHPPAFLSMRYRAILPRARKIVKDPRRSRVFTRDYFWQHDGQHVREAWARMRIRT